jgi:hypothetical protein
MAKTKTTGFYFKATPEEMAWIERRMAQTSITNKSAFLRKMAIDGHIVTLNTPEIQEIGRLLRITANNVNQLAKRVNSGGHAYREDVANIESQLVTIRENFGTLLNTLSDIADPKPGKRFVKPLHVRDLPEYLQAVDFAAAQQITDSTSQVAVGE